VSVGLSVCRSGSRSVGLSAYFLSGCAGVLFGTRFVLVELELIQTQMTQKPMLRAEVYARALRASQNRKEDSL
jgi:hypothetical protein